jgi:hypothetical protein
MMWERALDMGECSTWEAVEEQCLQHVGQGISGWQLAGWQLWQPAIPTACIWQR